MQGFLFDERGSTRLAVSIAAGVLAVLAVFAVPMVSSQGHRAQDSRAQSDLSRLVAQVERCRVSASSYTECDERTDLRSGRSVRWGRHAGQAGVLVQRSEERAFTAYAVSGNARRLYVWVSRDSRVSRHVCRHGSVKRLERDGCDEPGW